ncbi:MAG: family 78 glycoside hydrolase catalytic domain [Lachnospiraceae bacterium]|nr:family 78 glycoside hydrolase catalytic domain [Lachnospiraceae bacterium]
MRIYDMKIDGVKEAIGFATEHPAFSFKVDETESKDFAEGCITVARDEDFSDVVYEKKASALNKTEEILDFAVIPRTRYFVRVSVTGDAGDRAVGETFFESGKMGEPFTASWIGPEKGEDIHPRLSKAFSTNGSVKQARLYAAGVGLFEAYLNGQKLGDEYLLPGCSSYEDYLQVITFPVENLNRGENTLSFLLGKGWYMGTFGLEGQKENFGNRMAVIGELHIDYEDGRHEVIPTDASFTYTSSDIMESGIYFGEVLDRTAGYGLPEDAGAADAGEMAAGDAGAGRRTAAGKPVCVIENPETDPGTASLAASHLRDRLSPYIRPHEVLTVQEVITTPAGETVLDFGQNHAGLLEIALPSGMKPGTVLTFEFGEILQNGNFYRDNYREAESKFVYISDGRAETVRQHFTYYGFRYVRVTGWTGKPDSRAFRSPVLYSDLEQTGFLQTNNAKVNRLIENTLWGQKSNFIDLPTDCPQRNERLGWTGDANVFAPTASYHMDTRAFFRKFLYDLSCEQKKLHGGIPNYIPNIGHKDDCTALWGDVSTMMPDTLYRMFSSGKDLARYYPMMKAWVDFVDAADEKNHGGEKTHLWDFGFQFGDWLGLDGASENSFKGGTEDAFVASVYYAHSASLVACAAKTLAEKAEGAEKAGAAGKAGASGTAGGMADYRRDEAHYSDLAKAIRDAVLDEYVTPNGRLAADTQTSYIIALKYGIFRDREKLLEGFRARLHKDRMKIRCGFAGAPIFLTTLGENGMYKEAYELLLNEDYPGWLYAVNMGATTVWERWNSVMPDGSMSPTGMNSLNHYSYGSVMEFVYACAAGLRPKMAGFKEAYIVPHPDIRLPEIACCYDSVSGRYVVNTRIMKNGRLSVHIEVPFGAKAYVTLPGKGEDEFVLTAGSYDYEYAPVRDYRKVLSEGTTLHDLKGYPEAMEILQKHLPSLYGIAMADDPEFAFVPLPVLKNFGFLGIEPAAFEKAEKELGGLTWYPMGDNS